MVSANIARVFNERDAAARRAAIDDLYAEDVVFQDPDGTYEGRDAVAAKVDALLAAQPGMVLREERLAQEVADLGLAHWALGPPGGEPVVRGTDVALVRAGRIERLYALIG